MRQILQSIRAGKPVVASVPEPVVRSGHILVANTHSLISAGTEKLMTNAAKKSLLQRARERPDQVRQLLERVRTQGVISAIEQVRDKMDAPQTLGYASAGVVLACGAGVQTFKPGDRVASNGPHAGVVCVPMHLCAHAPENVTGEQAAFTVLGAIALQGIRLARLGLGEVAFVVGLGLIGQITVALLRAQGCRVLGTDLDPSKCELAQRLGAEHAAVGLDGAAVRDATRGLGADAVLLTASTPSDAPIELAGDAVRARGRVVVVGAIGMNVPRTPYYLKEAELVVSCSYGPGRYDPRYEERGQDYPAAHVRWTEQRNMQAVLDLMGRGILDVGPLISHRFPVENAERAYQLIDQGTEPYVGIILEYPPVTAEATTPSPLDMRAPQRTGRLGVGVIGAGGFGKVLLPLLKKQAAFDLRSICSAGGISAWHAGRTHGFASVVATEADIVTAPDVDVVFILTRHNQHGAQVLDALHAGKHVFVEKPLALSVEELSAIEAALAEQPSERRRLLMVGYNRRFAPAAEQVRQFFSSVRQPLTVSIRFNAGELPPEHWTQDEDIGGGRIIGEACHAIDLATFLTGAPPIRVFAESIGGQHAPTITDDQCFITLRHANGGISSIAYLAGGDRSFPKERVEILGGGRIAVIDDFRSLVTSVGGRRKEYVNKRQDKGHSAQIDRFAHALRSGGPAPISWQHLRAVSLASILAVRSLREGVPFDV